MEDKEETPKLEGILVFPKEVEEAIAEVFPSDDPLDKPDFDTVAYINHLFPTEQSLTVLDDVIADMRTRVQGVDDDIRKVVRNQTHAGQNASEALEEAEKAITELFGQIRDIKQKAGESEAMVRDITRDIKQLDTAKKNLTSAITTLNHLHMLVGGVNRLQLQTQERHYSDAANLLQGLMLVLDHFRDYTEIPQIKELSSQVSDMSRVLGEQINKDFDQVLNGDNASDCTPTRQLAEACLVVDVLDPGLKKNLLKKLVGREMAEYGIIFADTEEGTWLDQIDNRYTWLKRHLIEFEQRLGPLFPPDWEMSERIAVEFCSVTRKSLEKLMFKRKHEIDTKLLLHAIQKTSNFESLLSRRFVGVTLSQYREQVAEEMKAEESNPFHEKIDDPNNPFFEKDDANTDTTNTTSSNQGSLNPFSGLISQCFEPYLSIYIESQDRNLRDLIERAAGDQKTRGCANLAVEGAAVLHSCGDLFMFYKKCMVQCVQLSNGEPLLNLANVFKKHLREYASRVLLSNLPKANPPTISAVQSVPNFKELKDVSGLLQNFQSFLKEGDSFRLSDDEKVLICTFLVTSEYCLETTQQLEGKLKEKISPNLADQVNMSPEQDVYHGVINNCIQLLVKELEVNCEPFLLVMDKMQWSNIDIVGDQSSYVTSLVNHMKQCIPLIRDSLANSKKYFTQFCVKFVNVFIPKFIQHIYRCKPISTVGAEQLLLDTHSVKTLLMDLPSIGAKSSLESGQSKKAPASYTKIVIKGMTRAEMTLKVVMSHAEPLEQFVEQYIKLVPEADTSEFQKVLDMKGIRKVDQNPFIEYFKSSVPENLSQNLSPVNSNSSYGIKKLEKLIKKGF